MHGKIELVLSDRITTSCPSSFFLHIPRSSWFRGTFFFRQWPRVSSMKYSPYFYFLCSFLCIGALSVHLCRFLFPSSLFFFQNFCKNAGNCVLVTLAAFESRFSGSTAPILPEACQEMWMDSVDYQEVFCRSLDQETGKYFMSHHWFIILASFFPWKIFSQF